LNLLRVRNRDFAGHWTADMIQQTFDHETIFDSELGQLNEVGRYRVLAKLERRAGHFPRAHRHAGCEVERSGWQAPDLLTSTAAAGKVPEWTCLSWWSEGESNP
jgi:hypothetical protein